MRIAVYTDSFPCSGQWPGADFTAEAVRRLAAAHSDHEFLLISSQNRVEATGPNIRSLQIKGSSGHTLFSCRLMLSRLSRQLIRQRADRLLSMNGLLPLRPLLPSCLLIPEVPKKQGSRKNGSAVCLWRYLSTFTGLASSIAVLSEWAAIELCAKYGADRDKITIVARPAENGGSPMDWEERERVKGEYTEGREYLICPGTIGEQANIIGLMKGFSILKKRLRSNMMLLLAGEKDPAYREFPELLRTYHFRGDIKITGPLDAGEASRLTAAAYAMICPASLQSLVPAVLQALGCRVPVLAPHGGVLEETAGPAGLYFNPSEVEDMGNKCCEIYKNENLRAEKMALCEAQADRYGWDRTLASLWSAILQAKK